MKLSMIPNVLDSKMIGIEKGRMTTMINEVNTMTPRQNDLVVKNSNFVNSARYQAKLLSFNSKSSRWSKLIFDTFERNLQMKVSNLDKGDLIWLHLNLTSHKDQLRNLICHGNLFPSEFEMILYRIAICAQKSTQKSSHMYHTWYLLTYSTYM